MAMRCSLLGHDYGDPQVTHERDQRGSEVVVTVTEFERCQRCGKKHVISENTEVTSVGAAAGGSEAGVVEREPAEPASDGEATEPADPADQSGMTADGTDPIDHVGEDPTSPDDGHQGSDVEGGAEPVSGGPGATGGPDSDVEPATTDDGEILDADPEVPRERSHGEWPEADDVDIPGGTTDPSREWVGTDRDDEGTGRDDEGTGRDDEGTEILEYEEDGSSGETPVTAGGERSDAGSADPDAGEAVGPGTNHTTDRSTAGTREREGSSVEGESAEPTANGTARRGPESPPTETASGIASDQSAPAPGEGQPRAPSRSEFYCPQCDFVAPGDRGSLRTGDICPNCRRGYLGERDRPPG